MLPVVDVGLANPFKVIQKGQALSPADQIRLALKPRQMSAILAPILQQTLDFPLDSQSNPCQILDVKLEPGRYCIVLYQFGELLVTGFIHWDGEDIELQADTEGMLTGLWIEPLQMKIFLFPDDPALSGLRAALDPHEMQRYLPEILPLYKDGQTKLLRVRSSLQRYRPGKGAAIRLEAFFRAAGVKELETHVWFGKLFPNPAHGEVVYQDLLRLSTAVNFKNGNFSATQPVAFLPEISMILLDTLEGVPLDELLLGMGKRAWQGTEDAAAALATLHACGAETSRSCDIEGELELLLKRSREVGKLDPFLGGQMIRLAEALSTWLDRLKKWGAQSKLTHGDCKPSQFLVRPDHVALLDLDHCGMADPASDVGAFLASLRKMSAHLSAHSRDAGVIASGIKWLRALELRFLDVYCTSSTNSSEFRRRAAWYEAVALLRKALRSFGRSPFSPLPAILITEAWDCIEVL